MRVQLNKEFTFDHLVEQLDYLKELGVRTLYLSPILQARPGSMHGYDVVNHRTLNPELGGEEGFERLMIELKKRGMTYVVDIVPNHVGVRSRLNEDWWDVLKHGRYSPAAERFGIDFNSQDGKITVPYSGTPGLQLIEDRMFTLHFNSEEGTLTLGPWDHHYPVCPHSLKTILFCTAPPDQNGVRADNWETRFERTRGDDVQIALDQMPWMSDLAHLKYIGKMCDRLDVLEHQRAEHSTEYGQLCYEIEQAVEGLSATSEKFRNYLAANIKMINESPALMKDVYQAQHWQIHDWIEAEQLFLNVSRFFDDNELWKQMVDNPEVFERTHRYQLGLIAQHVESVGIRIDHIDGLRDPAAYCRQLQEAVFLALAECEHRKMRLAGDQIGPLSPEIIGCITKMRREKIETPRMDILAEKITEHGEPCPDFGKEVSGATGYDFSALAAAFAVSRSGQAAYSKTYADYVIADYSHLPPDVAQSKLREDMDPVLARRKAKGDMADGPMKLEFRRVGRLLYDLFYPLKGEADADRADAIVEELAFVLREASKELPVYRTYGNDQELTKRDRKNLAAVFDKLAEREDIQKHQVAFVRQIFFEAADTRLSEPQRDKHLRSLLSWQELTGPVHAKGVECYLFNRLLHLCAALRDVGGNPERTNATSADLHELAEYNNKHLPRAMITDATHDSKLQLVVRSMSSAIAVTLENDPSRLLKFLNQMDSAASPYLHLMHGEPSFPNVNKVKFQVLTSILVSLPFDYASLTTLDKQTHQQRVIDYVTKSLKEGNEQASYKNPRDTEMRNMAQFMRHLFEDEKCFELIKGFTNELNPIAARQALGQMILKFGGFPGIPDSYQGTEVWFFGLTDPDNRRLVDYDKRREVLNEVQRLCTPGNLERLVRRIAADPTDNVAPMYVVKTGLEVSNSNFELFQKGDYYALPVQSFEVSDRTLERQHAFMRKLGDDAAITLVDLSGTGVSNSAYVELPDSLKGAKLRNSYTQKVVTPVIRDGRACLYLADVCEGLPGAVLVRESY